MHFNEMAMPPKVGFATLGRSAGIKRFGALLCQPETEPVIRRPLGSLNNSLGIATKRPGLRQLVLRIRLRRRRRIGRLFVLINIRIFGLGYQPAMFG